MLKRLMLIGALVISVLVMSGPEATAQSISGWGYFGFSGVTAIIQMIHAPNPTSKPSAVIITITADVQIACLNPATQGIFGGVAFHETQAASTVLNANNITRTQGNSATVQVFLDLSQFEVPANCPNTKWTPIGDSAETLDFTGTVQWCLINTTTGLPNCSGKGLLDQSSVTCTLDTTLYPRNPDGTAPDNAVLSCSPPQ